MARATRQHILLRVGAFLIDALIIALVLILPASLLSWAVIQSGGAMNWIARIWNTTFFVYLVGILLRDGWRGRSLGKLIMGLQITTPSSQPAGIGTSVIRNLLLVIPGINLVEVITLFAAEGGRRLGDKLAKTTVIEG